MAKTRHNNFLDSVDEIITDAKGKGVIHLYTEDEFFSGRLVKINGKNLLHFGTTGYLGLEKDVRLKKAAIDAIKKYGTQFPLSKTYLSLGINKDLEDSLGQMYNNPILVSKNSTLADIAVIPTVVRDEDAVIIDHQAHWSIQNACQLLKPRGIPVEIVRHSNMNMLEEKIKDLKDKHKKIWFMCDGVYSMFGDYAPLGDLINLLDKYSQLHLYIDDVHGMSWAGKNGTGWVLSQIKELHPKMILLGTLSKSFGASGAVTVFPDEELLRKVKTFGGPLTFSAQLEPASVAAALASARIHLSEEIYDFQKELSVKVDFCNSLIKKTNLPLVEENTSPVFFIGTGTPAVGYNFVDRLIKDGFYVNLGVFPAVPVKNTGVRFTISRHNRIDDIENLINAMSYHYTKALSEEERSQNQVRKAFGLPLVKEDGKQVKLNEELSIENVKSIELINEEEWNSLMSAKSSLDWQGLRFLEGAFKNNEKEESNWDFNYFQIKGSKGETILATFFTTSLWKDDMLAPASVSKKIEEKRKDNPYYLSSKVLSMGSTFSEGDDFYLDKSHPQWKKALSLLLEALSEEQEKTGAYMIVLRDFENTDKELKEFFISQGFVKVDMPESCVIENINWSSEDDFLQTLSPRSKRHIKYEVLKYEKYFTVEVKETISNNEIEHFSSLYQNVKLKNFDINFFDFPKSVFQDMANDPNWEFIILNLKVEFDIRSGEKLPIGVAFNYKNPNGTYCFLMVGMDYEFLKQYNLYRQIIYQVVKRAKKLSCKKVRLGVSATIEKKKFGAQVMPKIAYFQAKDNYIMEFVGAISAEERG